jgi:Fe-S cluster assembly protein SufD
LADQGTTRGAGRETAVLQPAAPLADGLEVRAISERRSEPDWALELREKAWETYLETALPDRVGHLWRYTDPAPFAPPEPARLAEDAAQEAWPTEIHEPLEQGRLCGAAFHAGGGRALVSLAPEPAKAGVRLMDLHEALGRHEDLVRGSFARIVGPDHGKFEALNAALWQGGTFLHVPRNVQVERPVHIAVRAGSEGGFLAPRLLVVLEEGADLVLVDDYIARDGTSDETLNVNAGVEILLGRGSRIRYVTVQQLGREARFFLTQRTHVGRDARVHSVLASLGGSTTKADIGSVLLDRGAESELTGLLLGHGDQHFDHHTVHDHRSGNTFSNLDFKTVLQDKARSAYTGLIRIARDADGSEAYQENRNLMLSEGANAESIPELEIMTDEVRCTHGATMGPIDPEHLFYLASRGIPRREAMQMIVGGFIEPTIRGLPEDLRERLAHHVDQRLKEL